MKYETAIRKKNRFGGKLGWSRPAGYAHILP
jgi:hypothetical protein